MSERYAIAGMAGRFALTLIADPLNRPQCPLADDEVVALIATGLFEHPAGCLPLWHGDPEVQAADILYLHGHPDRPVLMLDLPCTRWRPFGFRNPLPDWTHRLVHLRPEEKRTLMFRHGVGDRLQFAPGYVA